MTKEIRIGIQKRGNLAAESQSILRNAGLDFAGPEGGLLASCATAPVQVCYERIKYIPEYVEERTFDLGIIGRDQLEEEPRKVDVLASLDFGQCAICVMGPPGIDFSPDLLEGKRIATSKPKTVKGYLEKMEIKAKIIPKAGNTENMIALGKADYVADIVNTGETARKCGIVPYWQKGEIFRSEAVLISNPLSLQEDSAGTMNILVERIKETARIK